MKLRIRTVMFATLLVATGFYSLAPATADTPQEIPVVTISLDAEGNVTVSPDPVVVNRGQTVEWTANPESAIERWTVLFRDPVPFGNSAAMDGFRGQGAERRGAALSNSAVVGQRYKYMVRVSAGQRVYVLDPEVEVGPGE